MDTWWLALPNLFITLALGIFLTWLLCPLTMAGSRPAQTDPAAAKGSRKSATPIPASRAVSSGQTRRFALICQMLCAASPRELAAARRAAAAWQRTHPGDTEVHQLAQQVLAAQATGRIIAGTASHRY